jgi:hypothetical protein
VGTELVQQTWVPGVLRWSISFRCDACGAANEADGTGLPPADLRDALLEQSGRYRVIFRSGSKVIAMKTLRATLGGELSLEDARARVDGALYTGTQAEAQWLKDMLAPHVGCEIVPEAKPAA